MRKTIQTKRTGRSTVEVSIRPVQAVDQATIRRWARAVADTMSRTCPHAEAADRHDPDSGLYWYVIAEDERDVGTVWIELLPAGSEAVLGVYLGDPSDCGRGIGTAAIDLAITELRRAHPHLPIVLRVRRSNTRAIACYRRVGFTVIGSGCKSLPSGEAVPYYRMVLPTLRQKPRRCLASPQLSASIRRALGLQ